jgi:hypothetical protein
LLNGAAEPGGTAEKGGAENFLPTAPERGGLAEETLTSTRFGDG